MNYHEILGIMVDAYTGVDECNAVMDAPTISMLQHLAGTLESKLISGAGNVAVVPQEIPARAAAKKIPSPVKPTIQYVGKTPDLTEWFMVGFDKPYFIDGMWHVEADFMRIDTEETDVFVLKCTDKKILVDFIENTITENEKLHTFDDTDDDEDDTVIAEESDDAADNVPPVPVQKSRKKRTNLSEYNTVIKLSPREQQLYDFLQINPNAPTTEIAGMLEITTGAVYQIKSSLRTKLNLMKPLKDRK